MFGEKARARLITCVGLENAQINRVLAHHPNCEKF